MNLGMKSFHPLSSLFFGINCHHGMLKGDTNNELWQPKWERVSFKKSLLVLLEVDVWYWFHHLCTSLQNWNSFRLNLLLNRCVCTTCSSRFGRMDTVKGSFGAICLSMQPGFLVLKSQDLRASPLNWPKIKIIGLDGLRHILYAYKNVYKLGIANFRIMCVWDIRKPAIQ